MTPKQVYLYLQKAQDMKHEEFKAQAIMHGAKFEDEPNDPFAGATRTSPASTLKSESKVLAEADFFALPDLPFGQEWG